MTQGCFAEQVDDIMRLKEYYRRKKQIVTFTLIGAGGTLFDLAVFNGILLLLGIGVASVLSANAVAYLVTMVIKYIANSRFTFANRRRLSLKSGARFLLIGSGTFLAFNGVMYGTFALLPATLLVIDAVRLVFGLVGGGVNFVLFRSLVFS